MAIINSDDSRNLLDRLARRGFSATLTSSSGGFLRISNTTVFCGVEDDKVEEVLNIIRESCPDRVQYVTPLPPVMEPGEVHIPTPVEKHMGGATIFVLDVEHYEKV
uniref:Transcriptional regulator n=2 Tax=Litorilinea aerophila TaxID=1204385 RepID=A0A540VAD1_9CHLR